MCADPTVTIATTLNGKYALKLNDLGNAIRQLVLEEAVRPLVGESGCRLYRILLRQHADGGCHPRGQQKLELKQLSELALMPERDVRPLLFRLLEHNYVLIQEVPRAADPPTHSATPFWDACVRTDAA